MSILEGLNSEQQEAVRTVDGPLLILAGAGSGKTRVLTHRMAYLIEELGVPPAWILAMTFTNKAAGEMRERVENLLDRPVRGMWIGTFHSLCARLLRMEAGEAGLQSNFTIYDSDDQLTLLRRVIRDEELSDKQFPPARVRARISREKNRMVGPEAFADGAGSFYEQQVAKLYRQYQASLRRNNALDFDDLLMRSVQLLDQREDVRAKYQERFRYILIDEYQDTNRPQYMFARLLGEKYRNVCVVGDDDQSIYAWRGADLRNILDFEKDYPEAAVIRLERNYRSTQIILDAGNAVIRNNAGRKGKELWTERTEGEKIRLLRCADEAEEARRVASVARDLGTGGAYSYGQMALLYRTNAQSRALEEGLRTEGVPYTIVGGVRFYERKEVKDILAYLKLIANPRDSVSLARVINTPRRGIGDTSVSHLDDFAMREGITPYEALGRLEEVDTLGVRAKNAMVKFYGMMEQLRAQREELPVDALAAQVVETTGYLEDLKNLGTVEAETRAENVGELLAGIQAFMDRSEDASLDAFLREVSLVADVDGWEQNPEQITLMTLHSAKGLEFPVVFIAGLEDGLLPLVRTWAGEEEEDDVEEERRLFYVGITRAQDRLYLLYAQQRRRFGGPFSSPVSRFLGEVPEVLIDSGFRLREAVDTPRERPRAQKAPTRSSGEAAVGCWVMHPTWGRGQVQARSGGGANARLTIRFQGGAVKKIVARFVRPESG